MIFHFSLLFNLLITFTGYEWNVRNQQTVVADDLVLDINYSHKNIDTTDKRRPNIILIMADNMGAWPIGCYGNNEIQTPNIDKLGYGGLIFDRAFSSNPVCSPTRATFFTGLIPSQHGVHCYIDNKYMIGPESWNTIEELTTLPEILSNSGYVCGLSGKWHLGDHLNVATGFSYWVCKPGGHTDGFYDQDVIESGEITKVEGYVTDYWTKRGIEFIKSNRDRKFFLALTYNGPYGLSPLMLRQAKNRWGKYYNGMNFESFVVDRMHPWQNGNKNFHNTQSAKERYASEISGIDDGIGKILETLSELKIDSNTLIIFTADQGWVGGQNGIWGMGDHTIPKGASDLMMRIPLIFYHPGVIEAGVRDSTLISNYDFAITTLNYTGITKENVDYGTMVLSPGRDFSSIIKGGLNITTTIEEDIFYEMENTRAIRTQHWKYIERYPDGPNELYNIIIDPQERFNVFGQNHSSEKILELGTKLKKYFAKYANPRYDLWNEGTSKVQFISGKDSTYLKSYFREP